MNDQNPFAAAWDKHKTALESQPTERELRSIEDVVNGTNTVAELDEEVFDFDGAQDFDQMMAELRPGHNRHTVRNYAKDRTLAGKKRRKAKRS